jgi:SAM-dependent methyltransferase
LERREKLVGGLDLQHSVGIEMGPLDRPVITKQDGDIIYVDHTDAASLKNRYKGNPDIDVAAVVNVDAVWGDQTLQEAIGRGRKVDYIVASHVIEHVPDLITWLTELSEVLKPGGEVRLAVPDRRFTFDYLRRETTLVDILNAHLIRARIPLPVAILDYCLNTATVSNIQAWEHCLDPSRLKPLHTVDGAMRLARDSLEKGNYVDVHCWVFTPQSFADLFASAGESGLIRFACRSFHDTERYQIEFFVTLCPCDDHAEVIRSWRRMERAVAHAEQQAANRSEVPAAELSESRAGIELRLERLEALAAAQTALLETIVERSAAERENLQRKLDRVYDSTSWRLTAPLRAAVDFVRGGGKSAGVSHRWLKQ